MAGIAVIENCDGYYLHSLLFTMANSLEEAKVEFDIPEQSTVERQDDNYRQVVAFVALDNTDRETEQLKSMLELATTLTALWCRDPRKTNLLDAIFSVGHTAGRNAREY